MLPQPTIYDQLITIKWKNKEKVRHELCWRNYELNRMVFLGRLRHFVKQFSLVFNEDHAICQVHLVLVSVHFLCLLSSAFPFLFPSLGFFKILWDSSQDSLLFFDFFDFLIIIYSTPSQYNGKCIKWLIWSYQCRLIELVKLKGVSQMNSML